MYLRLIFILPILLFTTTHSLFAQQQITIPTDADAGVRIVCRNDWTEAECLVPRGTDQGNIDGWENHPRYVQLKDQNNLDVGYWHFNLSEISAASEIVDARFQLDAQSNSWGDTTVSVFAIMDPSKDWDLSSLPESQIIGPNAPQADWEEWDPDGPQNRFNSPRPFVGEGSGTDAIVRWLGTSVVESQDANTEGTVEDPGNSYGGYACCDTTAGEAGSAWIGGEGDNIWPIKNAVDIDVTELMRWKVGLNPQYSPFLPSDTELTIVVRTDIPEFGGDNGFSAFIAKESEYIGGELDLAPGRIVTTIGGDSVAGDFNLNGIADLPDVNLLQNEIHAQSHNETFDLNDDGQVNLQDLRSWIIEHRQTWFGDSNLDGEFNSTDFVIVFQAGKYETEEDAGWEAGDWNADLRFDSGDLVHAFQDAGFELGPRIGAAVPESSTFLGLFVSMLLVPHFRRLVSAYIEWCDDFPVDCRDSLPKISRDMNKPFDVTPIRQRSGSLLA